jgi:UDP-N-acetylmuramoylalanine--D-glutamate ligase
VEPSNLQGKRVLVVGLAKSGVAAARLCAAQGAHVVANDLGDEAKLGAESVRALRDAGCELALGHHDEALFLSVDRIVVSPGVPALPALDAAAARGIPIASEIELASWFLSSDVVVGITGTNGKSTVTTLVGEMLARSGRPTFVGGNLGTPLVAVVGSEAARPGGAVVVELSSFQLERVERFRAHVAVLLNVTDDHLDRHGSLAAYAAAKARVFHGQRRGDHAVVPAGDPVVEALARAAASTLHLFGGADGEVRVDERAVVDTVSGLRVPLSELRIRGAHNAMNACAAALAARLAGVSTDDIAYVLRTFPGLPHRMVWVRERDGVTYYNDSKATNVGASVAALDGLRGTHERVVLIAGGIDKRGSYAPLVERLTTLGRAVVLIGQAAPVIERALAEAVFPIAFAETLEDAVTLAAALAQPGDAVLLAPACSSLDMFRSYVHRGDEFVRAVRALAPAESVPATDYERGER